MAARASHTRGVRSVRSVSVRGVVAAVALCVVACASSCAALYLPGVSPVDYKAGTLIPLKVRQLTSNHDLAYKYYDLPFCAVRGGVWRCCVHVGGGGGGGGALL